MKPALASFRRLTRLLAVPIFFILLLPYQAVATSNINVVGSNIVSEHGTRYTPTKGYHPQNQRKHPS
jgi:hypothetical protein